MIIYQEILKHLESSQKVWLITGVAGFIGSNLLEHLLLLNQRIIGLDNFSTGCKENLQEVKNSVSPSQWENFTFIEGNICNIKDCMKACSGVNYVLHQAALGSVPRSISDPLNTNNVNITGFLNILVSAKDSDVDSFTYAASSSTYGDHPDLPKLEDRIGKPLSPYAVTKYVNELYADVIHKAYDFSAIGLRYFNVFGKRQDPNSAYAAVIPKWASAMIKNTDVIINGDGETSRDFCFIENVIQANILAAVANDLVKNEVYNISFGGRTTLNELYKLLNKSLISNNINSLSKLKYLDFRPGDVRHSQANISKARDLLGYNPEYDIKSGIDKAMPWYIEYFSGAYW